MEITSMTPVTALAAVLSSDFTLPPYTGQRSMDAYSMLGKVVSMP